MIARTTSVLAVLTDAGVSPDDIKQDAEAGARLAELVVNKSWNVHNDEVQLRDAIRFAQRALERTVAYLDAGTGTVNSLGVLQGTALDVDRGVALRARDLEDLQGLVHAYVAARVAGEL